MTDKNNAAVFGYLHEGNGFIPVEIILLITVKDVQNAPTLVEVLDQSHNHCSSGWNMCWEDV